MLLNKNNKEWLHQICDPPATLTLLNVTPVATTCSQQPSMSKINHNSANKQDNETQWQLKLIDAILALCCTNFSLVRSFVKQSNIITPVGAYYRYTSPPANTSLTKWCWISMCLVQVWYLVLCATAMHPWLSANITMERSFLYWRSRLSLRRTKRSQIAFWVACVSAIYSASVDYKATVACFLVDQETGDWPARKIHTAELLSKSKQPAQSLSSWPVIPVFHAIFV